MLEHLIGFDAREAWLPYGSLWDEQRRGSFLLREDVDKPLSTDILVWPTVFDYSGIMSLSDLDPEIEASDELEYPSNMEINGPLFLDLQALIEHVSSSWAYDHKPVSIIAIKKFIPEFRAPFKDEWEPEAFPTNPCSPSPSWQSLGYDVSDDSLLSALTNCGYTDYTADERRALSIRWRPFLNRHHLLTDLGRAEEFRELSNQRVPEHAQFYIYELFHIAQL